MKNLPINMDELAFVLHRGPDLAMECFLDIQTGRILSIPTEREVLQKILKISDDQINQYETSTLVKMIIADGKHLNPIPDNFDEISYELMSSFIPKLDSKFYALSAELEETIINSTGFKKYINIIHRNHHIHKLFIEHRDQLFLEKAEIWLKKHIINPSSMRN